MAEYKVRCLEWDEEPEDAVEIEAVDPEDAVENWCRDTDDNSGFVDAYPAGMEVEVISPDGTVYLFTVDTDWDPSFVVHEKANGG